MRSRTAYTPRAIGLAAAALLVVMTMPASSSPSEPEKRPVRTTKAFDAEFGALPPMLAPASSYATVAYFPSAKAPGQYLPVPIFSAAPGKQEYLTVRTVVRGIDQEEFDREVALPFPKGSDLLSLVHEGGKTWVRVGGTFRAASLSAKDGQRAATSVALTVAQFGSVSPVDLTDARGTVHFAGRAAGARAVDPGSPRALGLLAVADTKGSAPTVLSVLFDRPVFVEEVSFYPQGAAAPYPGNAYSTAFGMSVEFRPDPKIAFDPKGRYRVRFTVRDGKGRKASEDRQWIPKEVVRD